MRQSCLLVWCKLSSARSRPLSQETPWRKHTAKRRSDTQPTTACRRMEPWHHSSKSSPHRPGMAEYRGAVGPLLVAAERSNFCPLPALFTYRDRPRKRCCSSSRCQTCEKVKQLHGDIHGSIATCRCGVRKESLVQWEVRTPPIYPCPKELGSQMYVGRYILYGQL